MFTLLEIQKVNFPHIFSLQGVLFKLWRVYLQYLFPILCLKQLQLEVKLLALSIHICFLAASKSLDLAKKVYVSIKSTLTAI